MRDYLLVMALYENGLGLGPLENTKLDRFEKAEFVESKNRWAIVVDEHKTTHHQGPAEIVMDQRLYAYTKLYVSHLRPCFVASKEEHLFIKDDGHAFRRGTIGRRVEKVFKRAGVRSDVTVTATKICKLFSSSAAEMSPTKKRAINSHMKNKETTADANYVLKLNTQKASAAHQLMRQIIDEKPLADDHNSSRKAAYEQASNLKAPADHQKSCGRAAFVQASDSDDDIPLVTILGLPELNQPVSTQLSAGDKVVINSAFKDDIEAGCLLTRHQVRSKMRKDLHLSKYIVQKPYVKEICDFLRYQNSHVRQMKHIEEDKDKDGSKVVTLTSGSRCQWNTNSTKAIAAYFRSFSVLPSRSEILKHFAEDPVLSRMLKPEGEVRYEKAKNLHKKRRGK